MVLNRILASSLFAVLLCTSLGCDTNKRFRGNDGVDAAVPIKDAGDVANVCDLSKCPKPEMGIACCTPLAQCGMDPTGVGLACVANPGSSASELVCELKDCPRPTTGIACCTPFAQCGSDPFSSGLICFANPPISSGPITDAGQCDETECPVTEGGPDACCQTNGECGVDTLGIGVCFAPPPEFDAAVPPIDTTPPKHRTVTGECPSFLGTFGPVWGCCSDYGVCGTFSSGSCLLPVGTQIPVIDPDEDAGMLEYPRCTPRPKKDK
jgi:hypothetical protein